MPKRILKIILTRFALLPPYFRSTLGLRILRRLTRSAELPDYLIGNMGISSNLRCRIPSDDNLLLYGRPADYQGERGALEACGELSRHADCFVDIGAHKGYFSFFVRDRVSESLPIYLFEPDEMLYEVINENITRNKASSISAFQKAVGSFDGQAKFYRDITSPLQGSLTNDFMQDHEIVQVDISVCTFNQFAKTENIIDACVKVDIENAEFDFLDGAIEKLSTIKYLIIEVLGPAAEKGFIKKLIDEYSFQAYYIDDYILRHSADGSFDYHSPQYNWLFCRENPDSLRRMLAGNRKLKVYELQV
mgnify:CR=1 FL=1